MAQECSRDKQLITTYTERVGQQGTRALAGNVKKKKNIARYSQQGRPIWKNQLN